MHYLLIIHGENGDPAHVTICDTEAQRDQATLEAIYEFPSDAPDGAAEKELSDLREDGWLRFEGDPPLQWVNIGRITDMRPIAM